MRESTKKTGSNITSLREWAGLSQSDLADALGISQAFVSMVENGEKSWPLSRHEDLIRVTTEARRQREADQERIKRAIAVVREGGDL